jgi:hypothetical protein
METSLDRKIEAAKRRAEAENPKSIDPKDFERLSYPMPAPKLKDRPPYKGPP